MYFLDMYFPTQNDVPDFGSLKLTFVGPQIGRTKARDQYNHHIDMRYRKYVLLEADISKLDLINNAADGSEALIADAGKKYILAQGRWREWIGDGSLLKWSHF